MKYNVYGIGNAIVDKEFRVSDAQIEALGLTKGEAKLVELDELERTLTVLNEASEAKPAGQCGGGSCANTLVTIQQLGGKTAFACSVGEDEPGTFYVDDLADAGVKVRQAITHADKTTGQCLVLISEDGERTMMTYLGAAAEIAEEAIHGPSLLQSRYLYIEGYLAGSEYAQKTIIAAAKLAQSGQTKVALTFSDPSITRYCREGLERFLEVGVDILFCNEQEALVFAQTDNLEKAISRLQSVCKYLVVTMGEKGVRIINNEDNLTIKTQAVKPLDTTGAGDAFAGAYLFGLCQGMSPKWSAELANKSAGALIQRFGARLDRDTQQELLTEMM